MGRRSIISWFIYFAVLARVVTNSFVPSTISDGYFVQLTVVFDTKLVVTLKRQSDIKGTKPSAKNNLVISAQMQC